MRCRKCGSIRSRVLDTRSIESGTVIRRRRECEDCGERFTTYERLEVLPVVVIKRDGTMQSFDTGKIRRGVLRACEKRSVTAEQVDDIVEAVEKMVRATEKQKIAAADIGEFVLAALLDVDAVAYIRFASVYRSFQDIDEFTAELQRIRRPDGSAEPAQEQGQKEEKPDGHPDV